MANIAAKSASTLLRTTIMSPQPAGAASTTHPLAPGSRHSPPPAPPAGATVPLPIAGARQDPWPGRTAPAPPVAAGSAGRSAPTVAGAVFERAEREAPSPYRQ